MGNAPKQPEQQSAPSQVMKWRVIGRSVRGASHVRSGLPNQDAIHWIPDSGIGPPLILSISDGHGSPKSFRSDVGSRFAVGGTTKMIRELLEGQSDPSNLSAVKRMAEERLPQEVLRRWQVSVDAHLKTSPFTPEELEALEAKQGSEARRAVEGHPYLAYGATILSVLVTKDFILYFQLGDGDILVVMENEDVIRPLPFDERLFANQTTSLCTKDAWRDVRLRFQRLYGPMPALILLSTDGYANSFVNEEAFLQVGSDILDILREDGLKAVEGNLESWLQEASKLGSGDDITLGMVVCTDVLRTLQKNLRSAAKPKSSKDEDKQPEPELKPETPSDSAPDLRSAAPEEKPVVPKPEAPSEPEPVVEPDVAADKTESAVSAPAKKDVLPEKKPAPAKEEQPAPAIPAKAEEPSRSSVEPTPATAPDADVTVIAPPGRKRRRRIKDTEGGPIEPSKKLQADLFFDD